IVPLREATERSGDAPLIAAMLGHALVATEDPKNFAEAKRILKVAVSRDNQDPFAWYQLGIIYDREGDDGRAALATAERSNLEDNPKLAYASAQMAMKGIPPNTPDWLRAQGERLVPLDGGDRGGSDRVAADGRGARPGDAGIPQQPDRPAGADG